MFAIEPLIRRISRNSEVSAWNRFRGHFKTVGLGPGIQLGGQGIWFRVNSYIETDVRNRPSGVKVTFRISKALPTGDTQP
jgi:hypothetical protein